MIQRNSKILLFAFLGAIIAVILKRIMTIMSEPPNQAPAIKHAVVVGSGLAGLSASSQLIASGISVYLLERAAKPGGNSIKASSGINGAPTKYQPGPPLSDSSFYDDTLKSTGSVLSTATAQRESLISTLTKSSSDAISWLVDEKGVDLSVVAQLGGHSFPRTHRGAGKTPPGASIVMTLLKSLKESPLFHLETSCLVTEVLRTNEAVHGVRYGCGGEEKILHGPVISSSGGFGGDAEGMLAEHRPDLGGFPSTNEPRPGSQKLLTSIGAQLLDMDLVQVHPTSFIDPKDELSPVKFLAAELLRGEGGLLLRDGRRFVNEMETRKHVTDAVMHVPAANDLPRQWDVQLVIDEGVYNAASSHVDFYLWKGLMQKTTISNLTGDAFTAIKAYADAAAGNSEDPWERKQFGHWTLQEPSLDSVVYVGSVTPAVHFTMGGVVISPRSEVLDMAGNPIKGLWAAGEVTGGIHGENRLGGSSLLECVVFGRIAGEQTVKFLNTNKNA
ncbi:Fumarate reductase [Lachnellula suecica]|uniref:Fumarate reductase n=1 Tax=Lachnellula suecica TaxID=602035 RepID=A0A8T9C8L4_9HELO|nr:Fumarate reductase [Lachnellula suecica]